MCSASFPAGGVMTSVRHTRPTATDILGLNCSVPAMQCLETQLVVGCVERNPGLLVSYY